MSYTIKRHHLGVQWLSQSIEICGDKRRLDEEQRRQWRLRTCGVASALMCIRHLGRGQGVTVSDMLIEGLSIGAYRDGVGWIHSGLANLIIRRGLWAMPIGMPRETEAIRHYMGKTGAPFIASVTRGLPTDGRKGGHLVVVDGHDFFQKKQQVHVCDPDPDMGADTEWIDWERFKSSFSGRAILCSKKGQSLG